MEHGRELTIVIPAYNEEKGLPVHQPKSWKTPEAEQLMRSHEPDLCVMAYVILFVNTATLQGLKKPAFALWIGCYRQLLAPIALFWLATRVWDLGLDGIWAGVFGITWSAAVVAIWWARRIVGGLTSG